MTKYYAVHVGRHCGVLLDWPTCQASISGFPRARFKSFPSMEEAQQWLQAQGGPPQESNSSTATPSTTLSPATSSAPAPVLPILKPTVSTSNSKKITKYYAVHIGRQCGVLLDWPACQESISGFPGARFKSFLSMEEAQNWLKAEDISSASTAPSTTLTPSTTSATTPELPLFQPAVSTPDIETTLPSQSAETAPSLVPVTSVRPKRPADQSIEAINELEIGLSSEQISAFRAVVRDGKSVFLTGCAGTGKSFLLRKIIEALPPHSTFCTASTGVAAAALPRGTTIHYWWGCATGCDCNGDFWPDNRLVAAARRNRGDVIASATHLIIDEVSMISADFFTKLELVVRCIRQNGLPFGGLTLILTGDFLQLPPIFRGSPGDAKFCFESPAWHSSIHQSIELRRVFRQSDPVFIDILNQFRLGRCDTASVATLVSACGTRALKREFAIPDTSQPPQLESIVRTKLSPFNKFVDSNNAAELEKLSGESHCFRRQTNLLRGPNSADAELIRATEDKCNAPQVLVLKIGAQVVLLRNLNVEKQMVNGARGRVVDFVTNIDRQFPILPVVEFVNGDTHVINAECWESDDGPARRREVAVSVRQIPLKLAWSLTIHKCQGMSLDAVQIDLSAAFECGMAYTALSRCRSMQGLLLTGLKVADIRADPRVLQFMNALQHTPVHRAQSTAPVEHAVKGHQGVEPPTKVARTSHVSVQKPVASVPAPATPAPPVGALLSFKSLVVGRR